MSKDDLNYAIAHYSNENVDFFNYSDIFSLIQGRFAGVVVDYASGTPRV